MAARHPTPRPLASSLGAAALLLLAGHDARGQLFEWQGITVKQYTAQKAYEAKQKDDMIYKYWSRQEGYSRCVDDEDSLLAPTPAITCETMIGSTSCEQDVSAFLPNLPAVPTGRAFTGASCTLGGNPLTKELCEGAPTGNTWVEGGLVDSSLIFAGAVTPGPCGFAIPGSSITQLYGEEDCTVNGGTGREYLGTVAECTEYCINQCSNCAGFAYNSATTLCFMNHDMTGNPSTFSQSPPSAGNEFFLMNEASACVQAKSGEARCIAADGVGTGSGTSVGLVVGAQNKSSCLGITGSVFSPAQCVKDDCGPNDLTPECSPTLCEIVSGVPNDSCSRSKCEERGMYHHRRRLRQPHSHPISGSRFWRYSRKMTGVYPTP
eukprot:COSAG05_NODE_2513_length_2960_cov_5.815100_2_plen_378_part_00